MNTQITIITGKIHEGKTTLAGKVARRLRNDGQKIGGILSEAVFAGGKRTAYSVIDLVTGRKMILASAEKPDSPHEIFWSWYFHAEGMAFARNCLSLEYLGDANAVFVDEIGAMELENRGYCGQIPPLLGSGIPKIYLVVREQFVDSIRKKFGITGYEIITVDGEK